MIIGINHLTLSVTNVEQSLAFYTEVLGFRPMARWPNGAYLLAGDFWVCLVFDEETRGTALPEYTARLMASWGGTAAMEDGMAPVQHGATAEPTREAVPAGQHGARVAVTRATLQIDGMT